MNAPRAELERLQLEKINALLSEIVPKNPFQTERLQQAGIKIPLKDLMEFRAKVPFTTKAEIAEDHRQHPPYGTNLTYPPSRYTRYNQTSATTGEPLRWLDTAEDWEWMVGNWRRVFEAAGVGPEDRVYFAFSFGPFLGFWLGFEAAERIGCLCLPGGGLTSAARLMAILDNEVTVLCCTPTYAIRLGQVASEEKIDLSRSKVRALIVAGEPGASVPATRRRIESIWPDSNVYDHHGMTEVGPVSYECPRRRGVLHVMEDAYCAEVVDSASGEPISAGRVGELVLTPLGRFGSPLLRYRTSDLVQAVQPLPCACGSVEMALVGGILGRADDMVFIRGVNLYPGAVENLLREFEEVAEYRVEIREERSMTELAVIVEPTPEASGDGRLAKRLEHSFRTAFNLRVPVTLAEPGSLPRFEMKARRWVRRE